MLNSGSAHERVILSYVIPSWNRPDLVRRAVKSLLPQLTDEVEIIIYDDASDVPVGDILSSEARDSGRIRVIRGSLTVGAAVGRNRGWESSHGRWVSFMDDDCWCPPGHVQEILSVIRSPLGHEGYILHPLVTVRTPRDLEPIHALPGPGGVGKHGWRVSTGMFVLRKDLLEKVGGFDPELPRWQDTDLAIRLTKLAPPTVVGQGEILRTNPPGISSDENRIRTASARMLESYEDWFGDMPELRADVHRYLAATLFLRNLREEATAHLAVVENIAGICTTDMWLRLMRDGGRGARWLVPHLDGITRKYLQTGLIPT